MAPKPPTSPTMPNPATLHPPLSAINKAAMVAYLESHGYTTTDILKYVTDNTGAIVGTLDLVKYTTVNSTNSYPYPTWDSNLIGAYTAVFNGGGFGHTAPQTQGPDLNPWDWVKSTLLNGTLWTRVAEFAVGGILLAVGANAMLKGKR